MADVNAEVNMHVHEENLSPINIDGLKVKQLKDFLRKYGQPVTGKLAELKEREKGVLGLKLPSVSSLQSQDNVQTEQRNATRCLTPQAENLPKPYDLKGGWTNYLIQIPDFTEKQIYTYLVLNNDRTFDNAPMGAHKQLKAKVMSVDNHVYDVRYHDIDNKCSYCFVKCRHVPSAAASDTKSSPGHYVWVSVSKKNGQIHSADCSCTAGNGESCNHIATLLWTMVDIAEKKMDSTLASTSQENKWLKPRKRKQSPKKAEDIIFKNIMKCKEKYASKFRDFNSAGPANQNVIDFNEFRYKMQEILP